MLQCVRYNLVVERQDLHLLLIVELEEVKAVTPGGFMPWQYAVIARVVETIIR